MYVCKYKYDRKMTAGRREDKERRERERERETAARFSFWFIRMTHRSRVCISPAQINVKLLALGEREQSGNIVLQPDREMKSKIHSCGWP